MKIDYNKNYTRQIPVILGKNKIHKNQFSIEFVRLGLVCLFFLIIIPNHIFSTIILFSLMVLRFQLYSP
jgi:hypothetical protein